MICKNLTKVNECTEHVWMFGTGEYVRCLAEETERACFGANFSSVHSQNDSRICLKSLARKKSSLQRVINCDSALHSKPLSLQLCEMLTL
jgi:hypothetical protein